MARKSKLTPEQWTQIEARLPTEGASVLGREYGISEGAIRKRFGSHESISAKSAKVREVAQMLADAHTELAKLPEQQRPTAISLADQLRKVAQSFSAMAVNCSETAFIVSASALTVARKVNMEDPMTSQEHLQNVAALSKVATEAANPGLQFLRIMVPGMPDDSAADATEIPKDKLRAIHERALEKAKQLQQQVSGRAERLGMGKGK